MKFLDILKTDMGDDEILVMSDLFYDEKLNRYVTKRHPEYIEKNYLGEDFKFINKINLESPLRQFIGRHAGDQYSVEVLYFLYNIVNSNIAMHARNSMEANLKFAIEHLEEKDKYLKILKKLEEEGKYIPLS